MKRNVLISVLQVWGIILVVIGHSFYKVDDTQTIYYLREWIYSFHMPLFMFISGFLLEYGCKKRNLSLCSIKMLGRNGFIWKKFKRLLIPYFIICSIAFIPKALMSQYAMHPVDISLSSYFHMLMYPWHNVIRFFWFLPTLFIIFCVVLLINKSKLIHQFLLIQLVITLFVLLYNPLSSVLFLNISGVLNYLFYFILGIYCCKRNVHEYKFKRLNLMLLISFVISVLFITIIPDFIGKEVVAAVNGIAFSIMLANFYINKQFTFLHHLFGASYTIYLLSWFPQVGSQQVLTSLVDIPVWIGNILASVTGLYIPFFIYKIVGSYRDNKYGRLLGAVIGL